MVVETLPLMRQSESKTDVVDTPLPLTSGETRRSLPYLSGLIAVLFWGATPAATVLVAHDIPSSLVGPSRLLLAAAFLLPIVLVVRPSLPKDRGGWIALAINGVVGFGASFFLQGLGFSRTTTSHAALILACAPVMTSILQNMLSRRFPRPLWLIGSAIALCGEAFLIFARSSADVGNGATLSGDCIVLIGTITVGTLVKISMVPRGPESLSIFERALLSVIENFFASFPPAVDAGMRSRFEPNAEVAPASERSVHGESAIEVDPITSSILSLLSAMNKANLEPTVSGEETMKELQQVKELADRRIAAAKLRIVQAST
jgi:drug/metabolite transporter (DMT)-like permease